MATRDAVLRSRRRLDERLAGFPSPLELTPPRAGWVRAVREALGMSLADLAGRMGVTPQTVHGLERSEQQGKAQLDSLRRAAVAMDCTLVYAFAVPHGVGGRYLVEAFPLLIVLASACVAAILGRARRSRADADAEHPLEARVRLS